MAVFKQDPSLSEQEELPHLSLSRLEVVLCGVILPVGVYLPSLSQANESRIRLLELFLVSFDDLIILISGLPQFQWLLVNFELRLELL